MKPVNDISAEYLRSIIDYDSATGIMKWKVKRQRVNIGDIAGVKRKDGRWVICIDQGRYLRSRLAWLHFYGTWAKHDVDHRNLVRSDDWIDNLRDAPRCWNNVNVGKKKSNTSGFKGVSFDKSRNKWWADLRAGKKRIRLGRYNCPTAAYFAYCKAAKKYHGEYARIT